MITWLKTIPQFKHLNPYQFPKNNWSEIFKIVTELKKEIILLANDIESLEWTNSIQDRYSISAVELHSTGLNDIFLLQECLKFKKTVILAVGGSSFDEILYAVDFLKRNGKEDILLMHGFQNYPTHYSDINFKRMDALNQAFSLPIGYADHTDPGDNKNALISALPQFSGYNVLEKHVTNDFW